MTRDRRGFQYALEPMRSMTEWEIADLAREYARLNSAVAARLRRVDALSAALAAVRTDVLGQRKTHAVFKIDAQRMAHAYMNQVQQNLLRENAELSQAQQERDACFAQLTNARKFADSLERDKESAAAEHDQKLLRQDYQQSDDNWLQRLHWRKMS